MKEPSSLFEGLSDNACVDAMAEEFAKLECQLHTTMWIARVPSKSNIADPPSRGITDISLLVGAEDVTMLAKQCLLEIIHRLHKWGDSCVTIPD